jgi:hypothetical protein
LTVVTNRPLDTDAIEGTPRATGETRPDRPQPAKAPPSKSAVPTTGTIERARDEIMGTWRTGHILAWNLAWNVLLAGAGS